MFVPLKGKYAHLKHPEIRHVILFLASLNTNYYIFSLKKAIYPVTMPLKCATSSIRCHAVCSIILSSNSTFTSPPRVLRRHQQLEVEAYQAAPLPYLQTTCVLQRHHTIRVVSSSLHVLPYSRLLRSNSSRKEVAVGTHWWPPIHLPLLDVMAT